MKSDPAWQENPKWVFLMSGKQVVGSAGHRTSSSCSGWLSTKKWQFSRWLVEEKQQDQFSRWLVVTTLITFWGAKKVQLSKGRGSDKAFSPCGLTALLLMPSISIKTRQEHEPHYWTTRAQASPKGSPYMATILSKVSVETLVAWLPDWVIYVGMNN